MQKQVTNDISLKYQLYIPYKEIKIQQCLFSYSESYPHIMTR
jgi:hypothetical protein